MREMASWREREIESEREDERGGRNKIDFCFH